MDIKINSINNHYFFTKHTSFRAEIPHNLLKPLASDEFISSGSKITVEEFKNVFFDTTLSFKEKLKKLNISHWSYCMCAKKLGIKSAPKKTISDSITKERFDEVYNLDIPEKEKIKMLGISPHIYYEKMLELGYTPKQTKRVKEIQNIKREEFEEVFFDETLSEIEKHEKLGLDATSYIRKAREFNLKTFQIENNERIDSITKEDFDKVFFTKNLGIRHKCHMLGISEVTFLKLVKKYGYKTKKMMQSEHVKSITKEQFDKVFYDKSLNKLEKANKLGVSRTTYKMLTAKFGHASEVSETVRITIQEFDKVFFDDTLSKNEKARKLGINDVDYYYLVKKFGYTTKKQKRMNYIGNISQEQFLAVANDTSLSEAEKYAKLKLDPINFRTLAQKYGYVSKNMQQKETIKSITKEEFDKVFYNESLTLEEKAKALNISSATFISLTKQYGYVTEYRKNRKNVDAITKEVFDEIYKRQDLTAAQKYEQLGISQYTYRRFLKKFGYNK